MNVNDPIVLVAIGIFFGGAVGFLLGLMLLFLRRRRDNQQPQAVVPAPAPLPPSVPARNTPKDSAEILSLWRNERTGKLVALLETKPLSPSHLTDEQKDKITQILAGLHTLIGDITPSPAPVAEKSISPSPSTVEQAPPPVAVPAIAPEPYREESTLPIEEPPPGQAEKVYFADTLPEPVSLRQALTGNPFKINVPSTAQKSVSAPKSVVEQIDEILQEKLAGSPFADRGISLKEAPHGMTVLISSYKYEGIDTVPDPAIRALIKESAREWNEKVSRKRA